MIKEHPEHIGYGADEEGNVYTRKKRVWITGVRGSSWEMTSEWRKKETYTQKLTHMKTPYYSVRFSMYKDCKAYCFSASRFIWECFNGKVPDGLEIDHKNRCSTDNRLDNLRLLTSSEQKYNTRKRSGTSSKYKGVCFDKRAGKWVANCQVNGKNKYLGLHDTEEEARDAYQAFRRNAKYT